MAFLYLFAALGLCLLGSAVWLGSALIPHLARAVGQYRSLRTLFGVAAISYVLFMMSVVGNFLICAGLTTSLGGSAINGGVAADGSYHLSSHSLITPVSAETYWRVYRYEVVTDRLFDVMFVTGMVGIFAAVVATRLKWLPPSTKLSG